MSGKPYPTGPISKCRGTDAVEGPTNCATLGPPESFAWTWGGPKKNPLAMYQKWVNPGKITMKHGMSVVGIILAATTMRSTMKRAQFSIAN